MGVSFSMYKVALNTANFGEQALDASGNRGSLGISGLQNSVVYSIKMHQTAHSGCIETAYIHRYFSSYLRNPRSPLPILAQTPFFSPLPSVLSLANLEDLVMSNQ